jgi:hypothetical protein
VAGRRSQKGAGPGRLVPLPVELPLFPRKPRRCPSARVRKSPATAAGPRSRPRVGRQPPTAVLTSQCRSRRTPGSSCKSGRSCDQRSSLKTGRMVCPVVAGREGMDPARLGESGSGGASGVSQRSGPQPPSVFLGRQVAVVRCRHCLEVPSRALQSAVLVRTPGTSSDSHRLGKSHDLIGTALDVLRVSLPKPCGNLVAVQLEHVTSAGCSISIAYPSSVSNGGEQRHVRGQRSAR